MADASAPGPVLLAERLREHARRARSVSPTPSCARTVPGRTSATPSWPRVDALAGHMLRHAAPGQRALLLYPAGIDFVVAFFACLAAGIHAVPAAPAHRARAAAPALVLCAPEAHAACAAALARAGYAAPLWKR